MSERDCLGLVTPMWVTNTFRHALESAHQSARLAALNALLGRTAKLQLLTNLALAAGIALVTLVSGIASAYEVKADLEVMHYAPVTTNNPGLTEAMVRFAARHEYACTVEDVLARRSRLLFLDARQAIQLAPVVAGILREELGGDPQLEAFLALAQQYLHVPL